MSIFNVFRWPRAGEVLADEWEQSAGREHRMQQLRESGELIEDNEVPGVSAVHWAPLRPRATVEPPTAPGFYARRAVGAAYWSIVEVLLDGEGTLWWVEGPHRAQRVERDTRYEWGDRAYEMPR